MGIFDSIFSTTPDHSAWKPQGRHDAWVATVFGFVHLDGEMSDVEMDAWPRMILTKRFFHGVDVADLFEVHHRVGQSIGWRELCLRAASGVPQEDGPTLFAILCELAMCDGDLREKEKETLEALVAVLRMDESLAKQITEVMLIRMKDQVRFVS